MSANPKVTADCEITWSTSCSVSKKITQNGPFDLMLTITNTNNTQAKAKNEIKSISLYGYSSNNSFPTFPVNIFTEFPNLIDIEVQDSKVKIFKIPKALSKPSKLEQLELSLNVIDVIDPLTMAQFPKLTNVDFGYNKIKKITKTTFAKNLLLETIILAFNLIDTIEAGAFDNLKSLEYLYLDSNKLTVLKPGIFKLPFTKIIDLSSNGATSIIAGAFDNMPKVSTIYLEKNKLKTIPKSAFAKNKSLKVFDISQNNITTIDKDAFSQMVNMSSFDISDNNIKELPYDIKVFFAKMPDLKFLYIDSNPYKCAFLKKLVDLIISRKISTTIETPVLNGDNYYYIGCTK